MMLFTFLLLLLVVSPPFSAASGAKGGGGGGGGGGTAAAAATAPPPPGSPPPQRFLREPGDQTQIQGSHATLPCRVENKRGMLQWTRDGFGLGTERNLTGFDRYMMTGSDEEGEFTLDINPVLLEDDATFQCQVGAADGVAPIRSRDAVLSVTVPPEAPYIVNGDVIRTTEDREVEIECESRGGKPAAEITWLDGSKAVITEGITKRTQDVENTKRVTSISILKLSAKKKHHNTSLTCQAQNPADSLPKSKSILLLVEYAPQVKVSADKSPIYEGDDVTFSCAAHGNPEQMTYRWFVDNAIVPENHGTTLRVASIGRERHGKIVKCEVHNDIGKSEETETLDVNYAPRFVRVPVDVSGEKGQDAVLSCLVDGNPKPTYTWFKNGDMQTVRGHDNNLTVGISSTSVGKYICRASVRGFTEISASASVLMKGPPRIIRRQAAQYGSEGEDVRLVCEAFAIPPPETIVWSKDGFPLPTGSGGHYQKEEEKMKDGMLSYLTIKAAISSDFGVFNCSVANTHGEDSFALILERQKSLTLIIVLSAVIGGIILTMFAILLTVMCRRAGVKNHHGEKTANGGGGGGGNRLVTHFKPPCSTTSTNGTGNTTTSDRSSTTVGGGSSSHHGSELKPSSASMSASAAGSAFGMTREELEEELEQDRVDEEEAAAAAAAAWEQDAAMTQALLKGTGNEPRIVRGYGDYLPNMDGSNAYLVDGFLQQHPPSDFYHGVYQSNFLPHLADQPPPPPLHPTSNGDYRGGGGGLNVMDPRYAAKYGNPYLVQQPSSSAFAQQLSSSPQMSHLQRRQVAASSNGGRPYATLNSRASSSGHAAAAAGLPPSSAYSPSLAAVKKVNYAMSAGNGSLGRRTTGRGGGESSKYIVLPSDSEAVKQGALATHV